MSKAPSGDARGLRASVARATDIEHLHVAFVPGVGYTSRPSGPPTGATVATDKPEAPPVDVDDVETDDHDLDADDIDPDDLDPDDLDVDDIDAADVDGDDLDADVIEDDVEVADDFEEDEPAPAEDEVEIVPLATFDDTDEDDDELLVVADDEGDDEDEQDAVKEGEFVCRSCFLVKGPSQLADAKNLLCRDCA